MRVVRPGGYIVYSLRRDIYEANGYLERLAGLKEAGKAVVIEATDPRRMMTIGELDLEHQIWMLKIVFPCGRGLDHG